MWAHFRVGCVLHCFVLRKYHAWNFLFTDNTARWNCKQMDLYNDVGKTQIFIIVNHLYANMSIEFVGNLACKCLGKCVTSFREWFKKTCLFECQSCWFHYEQTSQKYFFSTWWFSRCFFRAHAQIQQKRQSLINMHENNVFFSWPVLC